MNCSLLSHIYMQTEILHNSNVYAYFVFQIKEILNLTDISI